MASVAGNQGEALQMEVRDKCMQLHFTVLRDGGH
jgi:hypothetical protein